VWRVQYCVEGTVWCDCTGGVECTVGIEGTVCCGGYSVV
jgi:hypothetical protein